MELKLITGSDIEPYIDAISQFRIDHFSEFPYLYQGDLEYERQYLSGYANEPEAILIVLTDYDQVVGVSTGMPLLSDSEIVSDAARVFRKAKLNPRTYFYIGETILDSHLRGQGWYRKVINMREAHARNKGFHHLCFLAVARANDHPQRPENYQDIGDKFSALGYTKTELTIEYHWPTIQPDGSVKTQHHSMVFWTKSLR